MSSGQKLPGCPLTGQRVSRATASHEHQEPDQGTGAAEILRCSAFPHPYATLHPLLASTSGSRFHKVYHLVTHCKVQEKLQKAVPPANKERTSQEKACRDVPSTKGMPGALPTSLSAQLRMSRLDNGQRSGKWNAEVLRARCKARS